MQRFRRDKCVGREHMKNTMTVAEILDALYDGIGASWVSDMSFVDEVAEWVERVREDEAYPDDEED